MVQCAVTGGGRSYPLSLFVGCGPAPLLASAALAALAFLLLMLQTAKRIHAVRPMQRTTKPAIEPPQMSQVSPLSDSIVKDLFELVSIWGAETFLCEVNGCWSLFLSWEGLFLEIKLADLNFGGRRGPSGTASWAYLYATTEVARISSLSALLCRYDIGKGIETSNNASTKKRG